MVSSKSLVLSIALFFFAIIEGVAQSSTFRGWLANFHKQNINDKWFIMTDIQTRSSKDLQHVENFLARSTISYKVTSDQVAGIGYAYQGTWENKNGKKNFALEHRIFEQYNFDVKLHNLKIANRLRLEQRFLQQNESFNFAQRFRYFLRTQIPLKDHKPFERGTYAALQNEVFVNVQNKEITNNHFFDQNRAYAGFGYRFNKALDIEAGYLYRYLLKANKEHHHILQVMIWTTL
jgi:hypothetical protein